MDAPEPAFYSLRVVVVSVSGLPCNGFSTADTRFLRLTLTSPGVVSTSGGRSVSIESHRTEAVANPSWTRLASHSVHKQPTRSQNAPHKTNPPVR